MVVKGRHYMDYPSKYYSVDVGLRNARLDYRQQEPTHIMENIVFNELRARGYSVDVGMVEIETRKGGKREKRQHEVDFVVNLPGERVYVQSAYALEKDEKREHEALPLRKTGDSFRKIIVTGDYQDPWKDESGVIHVGVIPFLLDKELIENAERTQGPQRRRRDNETACQVDIANVNSLCRFAAGCGIVAC